MRLCFGGLRQASANSPNVFGYLSGIFLILLLIRPSLFGLSNRKKVNGKLGGFSEFAEFGLICHPMGFFQPVSHGLNEPIRNASLQPVKRRTSAFRKGGLRLTYAVFTLLH